MRRLFANKSWHYSTHVRQLQVPKTHNWTIVWTNKLCSNIFFKKQKPQRKQRCNQSRANSSAQRIYNVQRRVSAPSLYTHHTFTCVHIDNLRTVITTVHSSTTPPLLLLLDHHHCHHHHVSHHDGHHYNTHTCTHKHWYSQIMWCNPHTEQVH